MPNQAKTSLLREQVKRAGATLQGMLQDIDDDTAHWQPGGAANSIAANAAHVIGSVDRTVNGL